jgi:hypothetical protein
VSKIDMPAQEDVLVGVLALEVQHLCHHQVSSLVIHLPDQEHDALAQQAAVDVIGPLAAARLLDHDGYHAQPLRFLRAHCNPSDLIRWAIMSPAKAKAPGLAARRPARS